MKQIYYAIKTLLHGRWLNAIKVISLAMGLLAGILLFSRVAYDWDYDSAYHKSENLYAIWSTFRAGTDELKIMDLISAPVASTLAEEMSDVIECATTIWQSGERELQLESHTYRAQVILADTMFFKTMGIPVLSGSPLDLRHVDVMFLSKSLADNIFGEGVNPIDKTLRMNNKDMTIKGVYADMPENTSLQHQAILSFATFRHYNWGYTGWNGGQSFQGFVRVRQEIDMKQINNRVMSIIRNYEPDRSDMGYEQTWFFRPLNEVHCSLPEVHRRMLIMSILGVCLLFITALNYVLISVSSLVRRAKAIGVHKCNGASSGSIFNMFLYETAFIIAIALVIVVFLVYNFCSWIEDIQGASVTALLGVNMWWIPALVVLFLFLIGAVLPGYILASVPVTQVFHRYSEKKHAWKHVLLFIQFAGVTFVLGLAGVVMWQHYYTLHRNLGFNTARVACAWQWFPHAENAASVMRNLPMVEDVSVAQSHILYGYSGEMLEENGAISLHFRKNRISYDYQSFMGMRLVEGRNVAAPGEILVNEEFVRQLHVKDVPIIGRTMRKFDQEWGTVVGIVADFAIGDCYTPIAPMMLIGDKDVQGWWSVRLREPFEKNLFLFNKKLKEIYPEREIDFVSLPEALKDQYKDVRRFRDSVLIVFVCILFIALMGVVGYANDEVRRRSKEIAIRKVNGARSIDIFKLLTHDVLITTVPSVILGSWAAWWVGHMWLMQFADYAETPFLMYLGTMGFVVLLVVFCVIAKSWRVAIENPVKSISNE